MPSVKKPFPDRAHQLLSQGIAIGEVIRLLLTERDRETAPRPEDAQAVTAHGAFARFADRHGRNRGNTSSALRLGRPLPWELAIDLANELGGDPGEWFGLYQRLRSEHEKHLVA